MQRPVLRYRERAQSKSVPIPIASANTSTNTDPDATAKGNGNGNGNDKDTSVVEEDQKMADAEPDHKEHADFVSCYLVSSRVPKGLRLFLCELQYECRSTMCYEDEDDAKGWNAMAVPFGELRGLESLHIECSVDHMAWTSWTFGSRRRRRST